MSASSKVKATTFQFASEDLEKKLDREYVLSHSHQENFFADNMNLVCGNGFNSKISASRQPLCSYSHPSIFCPSGDKLELSTDERYDNRLNNISDVITLRTNEAVKFLISIDETTNSYNQKLD